MLSKSYNSVKIRSLKRDFVTKQLKKIAGDIIRKHEAVREVSLFGSLANGNYTGSSDADILIILGEDSRRFIDRIPTFLSAFLHAQIPVDIFPYTEGEIKKLGKKENSFIKRILREKIILQKRKKRKSGS